MTLHGHATIFLICFLIRNHHCQSLLNIIKTPGAKQGSLTPLRYTGSN